MSFITFSIPVLWLICSLLRFWGSLLYCLIVMCKSLSFGSKDLMRTFVSTMTMRRVLATMKIIMVEHCQKTLSR